MGLNSETSVSLLRFYASQPVMYPVVMDCCKQKSTLLTTSIEVCEWAREPTGNTNVIVLPACLLSPETCVLKASQSMCIYFSCRFSGLKVPQSWVFQLTGCCHNQHREHMITMSYIDLLGYNEKQQNMEHREHIWFRNKLRWNSEK